MTNAAEHRPVILINARLKVLFLAPIFSSNLFHEIVVWFIACYWDCKYKKFWLDMSWLEAISYFDRIGQYDF